MRSITIQRWESVDSCPSASARHWLQDTLWIPKPTDVKVPYMKQCSIHIKPMQSSVFFKSSVDYS